MSKRLVIIGAGFAGMYAALSAARLRESKGASPGELEIALVAPEPTLVIRPRLYEARPETLTAPLGDVLEAIDVAYVRGRAETIDTPICRSPSSQNGDGSDWCLHPVRDTTFGEEASRPADRPGSSHQKALTSLSVSPPQKVGQSRDSPTEPTGTR